MWMVTFIPWQSSRSGWWSWLAGWPSSLLRWWTFCSTKFILHSSTLTRKDSRKGFLFTYLEEKKSFLEEEKVSNFYMMIQSSLSFIFKLFLDKSKDPEDINVKVTRNMRTSFEDKTEERGGLLTIPQLEQWHQDYVQAWLAFMLSSNKLKMTFNFCAERYGIMLKYTYKCQVLLLNFSWNHPWPFLTHTYSSWVNQKTLYSLKYSLMPPL